ncbi:monovalent cation/H+ antiporter subunit D family protein [Corynebacterium pseudopelargi]|uniref:Na(+)/H(+) antiporter subunit D n=1 Tax=Corynebacterium pseudopelargi TaxID=2080757 RepID=A0A3G6J233_9CORY|nr:monovalent cation/H+ antiporter subunit D family protein [Corynebacterium pseudopelargi]AZA10194.1 Na(+)/H(+) antiporter subunit D [Corynebacterium pseudopelargi]
MDYVLPLFVGLPLVAVALTTLAPWRAFRDITALVTPVLTGLAAAWLFAYTAANGTQAHSIGLYIGGVAIPFAADQFSAVMMVTTSIVAFASNWFAIVVGETRARYYAPLSLMLLSGVMGALMTADLFNFFVFIEVMLMPSYGLLAMTGTWARLSAGRTFVLVNLATSTVLLAGVALLYGVSGTVNIAALSGAAAGNGPITVAMGVIIIALAVKAGIFPVHTWLPRSYPSTSASVMGLFSGLHTKVAVYMIFRIYVVIFDLEARWMWLIIVICSLSMLVGAYAGLAENSMRRVISYQMVNGMPFILVMLAFATGHEPAALAAGILYMLHHMITVGSLILATGAVEETYGTDLISKLHGLAHRDPWVAAVFAAGAFSVVGFPPFSGLWGKVALVVAAAQPGDIASWIVIAVIVVASFGAFLSMMRLWRETFWGQPLNKERYPDGLKVRWRRLAPSAVLIVISFGMFLGAGPMFELTNQAAEGLLDVPAYQQAVLGDEAVGLPLDVQANAASELGGK